MAEPVTAPLPFKPVQKTVQNWSNTIGNGAQSAEISCSQFLPKPSSMETPGSDILGDTRWSMLPDPLEFLQQFDLVSVYLVASDD